MYFSALSIFWVFSSVVIVAIHILLPSETYFSNLSKSKCKSSSLLKRLLKLLWRLYMFGKLLGNHKETDDKATREQSSSTRTQVSTTKHEQLTGSTTATSAKQGIVELVAAIPKSWFYHFYLVGALVHFTIFSILIYVLLGNPVPTALRGLIHMINLGMDENGLDNNAWPVVIVFSLELLQMLRRLYECLVVSSFSKGTMSCVHYFFGIFLYSSFGLGLLASVKLDGLAFVNPSFVDVACCFLGICLFVWGSIYQHKSMHTFAALRKDKKDHKSDRHYIPRGHLFEVVSCPHYLCEILIYLALCLIFRFRNIYLLTVALFVWSNQICISIAVHTWYKEHFPGYPVTRKAIIPYIF